MRTEKSNGTGEGRARLLRREGFTLTEVLATVVLVGLMSLAVTAGVAAAVRSYRSIRLKADAQTLLGTAVSALTMDMSPATDVQTEGGHVTSFFSGYRGYRMMYQNDPAEGIMVAPAGAVSGIQPVPLLTSATQTLGLYVRIGGSGAAPVIDYWDRKDEGYYHCFHFLLEVVDGRTGDAVESKEVYIHSAESDLA